MKQLLRFLCFNLTLVVGNIVKSVISNCKHYNCYVDFLQIQFNLTGWDGLFNEKCVSDTLLAGGWPGR